jgi:cystathionine gamma-synthase
MGSESSSIKELSTQSEWNYPSGWPFNQAESLNKSDGNDTFCNVSGTAAIHKGRPNRRDYGPLTCSLAKSTNYVFGSTGDIDRFYKGELPFEYGRYGSPTVNYTEDRIAALEGGDQCLLFSSGMNAITTTILSLLSAGDHIIVGDDSYRRIRLFCTKTLARFGITSSVVPMGDYEALDLACTPNTKLLVFEVPTNPFLRVLDISRAAEIAKKHGALLLCDSTLASPCVIQPLKFGADLVIHSATKFLGGHNDLICGAVIGSHDLIEKIHEERNTFGGIADPDVAWRLERSLKTLPLRMKQHNSSALTLAKFLESQSLVERVWYPLLESHPDHTVATKQFQSGGFGGGGVVSFTLKGNESGACFFLDQLKIPFLADSLGGTESLVKHVARMSYYRYSREERLKVGITDTLIRYSVGLEECSDLIDDLKAAFCRYKNYLNAI